MRTYLVNVRHASLDKLIEKAAFNTKEEAEKYAAKKRAEGFRVDIIPISN